MILMWILSTINCLKFLFPFLFKICVPSVFSHVEIGINYVMYLWKLKLSGHQNSFAIVLVNKMWIHQCKCWSFFWKADFVNPIRPRHRGLLGFWFCEITFFLCAYRKSTNFENCCCQAVCLLLKGFVGLLLFLLLYNI